jgi:hypothetical protein
LNQPILHSTPLELEAEPTDRAASPRAKVAEQFGAPRRFGIGTMLVVMGAASVLLAALVAWGVREVVVFHLVAFLALIACAQAILFRGSNPRRASIVAGAILCPVYAIGAAVIFSSQTQNTRRIEEMFVFALIFSVMGPLFGYLAGGVVGGIFLMMDRWERKFGRKIVAENFDPFAPQAEGEKIGSERPTTGVSVAKG